VTLATFGLVTVVQSCTTLHKSRKDFCKNTDVGAVEGSCISNAP
jgi:hypothetical protein